jgi:16S rRNA (uracil1498-N3)-methyltransferase
MNIVLFTEEELDRPLAKDDVRALHVLNVIGCRQGDSFDVGLIDGPRGKARIEAATHRGLDLDFNFSKTVPRLYPVTMIIGLPRPPSARRILKDLTTQGADTLHFVATDKGEKSYMKSRLWTDGEYERLLREGAEQAFCTRLPKVVIHESLTACIEQLGDATDRLALDNYEAAMPLSAFQASQERCVLAIGSERGWSTAERNLLRKNSFKLVNIGDRVLKTETACIAGLTLILHKMSIF